MRVMVIVSDQRYSDGVNPFPPVGTKGTVIDGPDRDREYDILFDNWPIVSPVDPGWFAHEAMIVFIENDKRNCEDNIEDEVYA